MKKKIVKISILTVSVVVFAIISFFALRALMSKGNPSTDSARASIILSDTNLVFSEIGETAEISAVIIKNGVQLDMTEEYKDIVWTSSDQSVAIVKNGLVEIVGYGACTVRATYGDLSSYCTVSNPNPNPPLTVSADEVVLDNIGKVKTIYAISGEGENISSMANWRSSNENIAICEDGVIKAMGYGFCTITAVYNRKTAVCIVTVKNPTAPAISLSEKNVSLKVGESATISAATSYGAGDSVIWKTSDSEIATCENGVITAKKNGKCAVIAVTELGYTDICIVNVGSTSNKNQHENLLSFDFIGMQKELLCIDRLTGQISATALIIGYEMKTELLVDGRLVVEISLTCVKTYDRDGINGTNNAMITASLYREGNAFCDKKIYKSENIKVGDAFTVKCAGFTVQTKTDGTAREMYMTFSTITER